MAVKKGDFIKLNYTGSADGIIFDTTSEAVAKENGTHADGKKYEPIVICIGAGQVIPGLDEALEGNEIGKEYTIDIPENKAYGPRDNSLYKSVSTKEFKEKPTVGTRVSADGRTGVVVNIVGKRAVIDFNHMLAGKALNYKYTIESVVEDKVEQAKAVFKLFMAKDFEMELNNGTLTIVLPPGITYDQRWMMGKGMATFQIFDTIDGIEEIVMKETFKKPAKDAETAPVVEA